MVLVTKMGKIDDRVDYRESGKRKGSGAMSLVWDISNLRHYGT